MAQTQEVNVKIKAILDAGPSVAGLKELKKLQKEVGAGSSEFKLAQAGINDFNDSIKTAKGQSQDWIDTLGSLPGPIGSIGRGLDTFTSSTNKLGLAFKSLGIGLIVAAVGALTSAFSQNDKMMKKLEPLMIGFEKILGGIFTALEPVIDAMLNLALQALPYITEGIGMFYSGLVALFSLLKNAGAAVGKILKGIFTLDFDAVSEGIDQLSNSWDVAVKSFKETMGRYQAGTDALTKTEKKNAEDRADALAKETEKKKKALEQQQKEQLANLEKEKAIALDKAKTDQERLDIESKAAEDAYNIKKKTLEDTQKLYKKDSDEYKDIQAQLVALDAEITGKRTEFRNRQKEIDTKAFQDELKALQDANKRKLDDLTNTYNEIKQIYGENSEQARKAQDEIYAAQLEGLAKERQILEAKKELSKEEKERLDAIIQSQKNLTSAIVIENDKRKKSDVESKLKTLEEEKRIQDQKFAYAMEDAENNLLLQQETLDKKLENDRLHYEKLIAVEGLTAAQRQKIEEDYTKVKRENANAQEAIDQKKYDNQRRFIQAISQALKFASQELGENTREGKGLAVAAALIDTYGAIAAILKAAGKGPRGGIPGFAIAESILAGYQGFKAVQGIIKTKIPSEGNQEKPRQLWSGGYVSGVGSGRSDMIPAMLSNGESVINAQSTAMFRPLLSSINAIGGGKRFADGGMAIGGFSQDQALSDLQNSLMSQTAPIKTYVVASDMTNQQMLDRNIKDRSTL